MPSSSSTPASHLSKHRSPATFYTPVVSTSAKRAQKSYSFPPATPSHAHEIQDATTVDIGSNDGNGGSKDREAELEQRSKPGRTFSATANPWGRAQKRRTRKKALMLEVENAPRTELEKESKTSDGDAVEEGQGWLSEVWRVGKHESRPEEFCKTPSTARTKKWYRKSYEDCGTETSEEGSGKEDENETKYSVWKGFSCPETYGRGGLPSRNIFSPLALNQENIAVGMSWLWQTRAFSDLTITCHHKSFAVHKCILAAQCRRFNYMIRSPDWVESTPMGPELALDDDDPEALEAMLQYLYTGVLEMPALYGMLDRPESPGIEILLSVYESGCRYELPLLKEEAAGQYVKGLKHWPKGYALLLAKCLVKISRVVDFAQRANVSGFKELMQTTLRGAIRSVDEFLSDSFVVEVLSGEPLKALVMQMSGRSSPVSPVSPVEAWTVVKSPVSSPVEAPTCASGSWTKEASWW